MLEEHRLDAPHVGNRVDSESRQVGSPAVGVGSRDSLLPPPTTDPVQPRHASPIQLPSISQQHPPPQDGFISQLQSSLQSQLHVHSQILEEQRQELENQRLHLARIDGVMETLHHEQRTIFAMIDEVRHEVRSRAPVADRSDMAELDILTEQVQNIGAKANEVTGLKMQLEILRSQLRRLERHGSPAPSGAPSLDSSGTHEQLPPAGHVPPPTASFVTNTPLAPEHRPLVYATPTEARLPAPIMANPELSEPRVSSEPRMLPGFRSIDPASSATVSSWRPAGAIAPQPPVPTVASSPQIEPPAPGSGWAAVNSNSAPKRLASDTALPYESPVPGSPKRQRLAPLMPRTSYEQQNPAGATSPYHPGPVTESLPAVPSLQSTRNPSNDSSGSVPPPTNALRFVQFASGSEAPPEEAWRQEAARPAGPATERARGSPRRGRGGRGRGGRKSAGGEGDRATPEYEYNQSAFYGEGRVGLAHHGGPSGPPPGEATIHAAGMYPDPHFMPITTTADVASSSQPTKKTRTKPVRNAEGILIRKDGRPDMRSVSSAMNLKKVHAKKEAERANSGKETSAGIDDKEKSSAHTPRSTSEHDDNSADSPSASPAHAHDESSSQDRRHQENMRKIFPYGIEAPVASSAPSVAQQFFPKSDDGRAAHEVKIEAMVDGESKGEHTERGNKPLIDGEKSMVHHSGGRVDVEMGEAE